MPHRQFHFIALAGSAAEAAASILYSVLDLRPTVYLCNCHLRFVSLHTAPTHLNGARPDLRRLRRQPAARTSIDSIIVFIIVVIVVTVVIVVIVGIVVIVVIVVVVVPAIVAAAAASRNSLKTLLGVAASCSWNSIKNLPDEGPKPAKTA